MVKFMRYGQLFRFYEMIQPYLQYSLHVDEKLPADNVLVLAPHADDETIGAGGTLFLHTLAGKKADVVVCTATDETRKAESREASKILGIEDLVFWEYPGETLEKQSGLPGRLIALFDEKKPDIVFLPFYLDNHTDHRALNKALVAASDKKKFDFTVYAYPVWSPLYPNALTDISKVWETKKKAIACYASQTASRDYTTMCRSLGQYWAQVKGGDRQVLETFFRASFSTYTTLGKKIFG